MRICAMAGFAAITMLIAPGMAFSQQWDWVQRATGNVSTAASLARDGETNLYVAGTFSGTAALGTNVFVSAGDTDIFVAKLTQNGEVLWAAAAGGPSSDVVNGLVAMSNGTVFVAGEFDLTTTTLSNGFGVVTNVRVAAITAGRVAWVETFAGQSNVTVAGIANGLEETVWAVGASNRVFIRQYSQSGGVLGTFQVGNDSFWANGITVNRFGEPYVMGRYGGTLDLGTTNLTASYGSEGFIAALDATGAVRWAWVKANYSNWDRLNNILALADGGVVTVGSWDTGLPQGYVMVTRHKRSGKLQWRIDFTGHRKSIYVPNGVGVDARGYLHVVGNAFAALRGHYYRHGIGIWTLSPAGQFVAEDYITSGRSSDDDSGKAIVVTEGGDIFIAGHISGRARFGTNTFSGFREETNAMVARRATVTPALSLRPAGAQLEVRWPRTSAPFALQRAPALATNEWLDVTAPPALTNGVVSAVVDVTSDMAFLRLRRTNELLNVPPEFEGFYISWAQQYSNGTRFVVALTNAVTNVAITTWHKDWNYDDLTVIWYDETGTNRLNTAITGYANLVAADGEEYPSHMAQLNVPGLAFPVGTNTLLVTCFDGAGGETTTALSFVVLSAVQAIELLIAEVERTTSGMEEAELRAPLVAARDAAQLNDWAATRTQMEQFRTRLQASTELTFEQRWWFDFTSQLVIGVLPPP